MIFLPISLKALKNIRRPLLLLSAGLTLTNCAVGSYSQGTLYQLSSKPLSLSNTSFRTCVFDPAFSIAHFPMYHFPSTGHYTVQIYEKVVRSQFQLIHTILDYNLSPLSLSVFDENFITDTYNDLYFQNLSGGLLSSDTYQRIDGRIFRVEEQMRIAQHLFPNAVIPRYYEHLSQPQKDFIFNIGASFTLYLLGRIPRIHKVISPESFLLVKSRIYDPSGQIRFEGNESYIYGFREDELKKEVLRLLHSNYNLQRLILIAYGASHDFSDDFRGYPFQSGNPFCLNWENQIQLPQPPLT